MAHVSFLDFGQRGQTLKGRAGTVAAAAIACIAFMGSTIPSPLYVIYEQRFGFSTITLTLIYAVYALGNLGALLLFGGTSDVKGRRAVALSSIGLAALAGFAYLFAAATLWLFIARLLSGLAIGLASGTATAWIAELDPDGDRARATQIMTGSNFFGLALGALLAGLLAQYAPAPLRLSHIVYLVLLAALALFVSRTEETVWSRRTTKARCRPVWACPTISARSSWRRRSQCSAPWRWSASMRPWCPPSCRRRWARPATQSPGA